jgi:hypothetical protein
MEGAGRGRSRPLPAWMTRAPGAMGAPGSQPQQQHASSNHVHNVESLYGHSYDDDDHRPVPSVPVDYTHGSYSEPVTVLSKTEAQALLLTRSDLQQLYNLKLMPPKLSQAMTKIQAEVRERMLHLPQSEQETWMLHECTACACLRMRSWQSMHEISSQSKVQALDRQCGATVQAAYEAGDLSPLVKQCLVELNDTSRHAGQAGQRKWLMMIHGVSSKVGHQGNTEVRAPGAAHQTMYNSLQLMPTYTSSFHCTQKHFRLVLQQEVQGMSSYCS